MHLPFRHGPRYAIFFVFAVLLIYVCRVSLLDLYENAAFAIAPSAERAAAYGEAHFNARHPAFYNIDRAEYFYTQAARLDESYPYVYHQLARVAFLHGNFNTAMFFINMQIRLHGDTEANSYYVRGLIEGYMGRYADAVTDYEQFLRFDPHDWAAINDYAWVLLKAERAADAARVTTDALKSFPDNPWLLNTNAIALYETGSLVAARKSAVAAFSASAMLTESEWLIAYPGNNPDVAQEGVATLRQSVADNVHTIEHAITAGVVPSVQ